jgi:hypothetical protein
MPELYRSCRCGAVNCKGNAVSLWWHGLYLTHLYGIKFSLQLDILWSLLQSSAQILINRSRNLWFNDTENHFKHLLWLSRALHYSGGSSQACSK